MQRFKEFKHTSGDMVRVYAPPVSRILQELEKKYPDPQPPIVESETVTGTVVRMSINDDPEYLAAVERVERQRNEELNEVSWLFAFKGVNPPDGFDIEAEYGDVIRMSNPDWQPRTGKAGVKLDWLEWEFLGDPADLSAAQETLTDMLRVDLEVVDQIEASFRGDVEGAVD